MTSSDDLSSYSRTIIIDQMLSTGVEGAYSLGRRKTAKPTLTAGNVRQITTKLAFLVEKNPV